MARAIGIKKLAVIALVLGVCQSQTSAEVMVASNVLIVSEGALIPDPPSILTMDDDTAPSSTVTVAAADGFDTGSESFSGSASATASFGSLGVFGDASAVDSPNILNSASGGAAFTDSMTVSGGTPGTPGTISFTFDITGSSTSTGDGTVVAQLYVIQGELDLESLGDATVEIDQGGFSFTTEEFPFNYDEEFFLSVLLNVAASVPGDLFTLPIAATGTATGSYENTVELTGIQVSQNGQPVGSFSITSGSGTQYPQSSNQQAEGTPEPGATTLILLGILIVAASRRIRHRYRGTL